MEKAWKGKSSGADGGAIATSSANWHSCSPRSALEDEVRRQEELRPRYLAWLAIGLVVLDWESPNPRC